MTDEPKPYAGLFYGSDNTPGHKWRDPFDPRNATAHRSGEIVKLRVPIRQSGTGPMSAQTVTYSVVGDGTVRAGERFGWKFDHDARTVEIVREDQAAAGSSTPRD
jgi:hypothetical protein